MQLTSVSENISSMTTSSKSCPARSASSASTAVGTSVTAQLKPKRVVKARVKSVRFTRTSSATKTRTPARNSHVGGTTGTGVEDADMAHMGSMMQNAEPGRSG